MAGHKWAGWRPDTIKIKDDGAEVYGKVAVRAWKCACGAELYCALGSTPGTCPILDQEIVLYFPL